jgi:hypothetical protein
MMSIQPGTQSTGGSVATNQMQQFTIDQLRASAPAAFGGQSSVANPYGIIGTGASGYVWLGPSTGAKPGSKPLIPGATFDHVAQPVPVETAINNFDLLPSGQLAELGAIGAARNGGKVPSLSELKTLYTNLVTTAGALQQTTQQYMSIFDIGHQQNTRLAEAGLLKDASSGVSSRVNLTNPTDAKVLVDNALQQYLGRDATKEEQSAFYKALQGQERTNPQVTTKTSSSGGVNTQEIAKEYAQARPDYAEYTTDTKFRTYLMSAITADPTQGMRSGL